ncbi:hypothetical protein AC579_6869 [Pseudocercospora musae]|uniref:Eisosome protein 1 n=1 Tax=Pseudocercospora musae TaxID=113226 RepID=A0A139HLD7_9PEZI|nr:hypothetical protein AC579_6869 [Pseudocercospora musae]
MAAEPCPDPSVHKHQHKLSEQASTAALHVTSPGSASNNEASVKDENVLGPDGKLSSKSAAASLKHAKPQDLPSFPSHGTSADSAGKAAMLAKDYKMKELWQPEQSMAGSKAAVLAAGKGGKVDLWEAQATAAGQSAASLAFKNKGLSPQAYAGNTPEDKSKALQAATMSAKASRARAGSTPAPAPALYPDAHNAVPNALNAATVSHRNAVKVRPVNDGGWNDAANQAARIKNSHMDPQLFTEHPDIQTDEDRRQAALKASAISMAKKMYEKQNRDAMLADPEGPGAHHAGARAAARNEATAHPDVKQEALAYLSLQDQAHKLAAERLAKIDKNMEASRFREHYGYEDKPKRLSSRLSMRSVGAGGRRGRAASESAANASDSDDDQAAARRIRKQMASLGSASKDVDDKRQREDRAKVLAAAEKRVSSRMHDMDQQVYRDTGKVSESMMAEWEEKARVRAQQEREKKAENPGRTHIGGGKYMDTADIEAIAAARLKGTLDEINATAEQRRARDAEIAAEKDEQERLKMEQKMEDQAQKEEWRRIRDEDKATARRQKEEEKLRRAEEKRLKQGEKRKSRDEKRDAPAAVAGGAALGEVATNVKEDQEPEQDTLANDGREKHASAFSRLKDHFRKSGSHKVQKQEQETAKESETSTAPVVAGGAVGAATGATMADIGHSGDKDLDAQQASHVLGEDESRPATATTVTTAEPEVAPVAQPVSPLTEEERHLETKAPAVTSAEPEEVHNSSLGRDAGIVGTSGAAVGAGFLAAHEISEHKGLSSQRSSLSGSVIADEGLEDDKLPPEDPSRPKFEQQPSFTLNRDEIPTNTVTSSTKPNLERHISQIPESDFDDSDEDSDDWNEDRVEKSAVAAAPVASAGVIAVPAAQVEAQPEPPIASAEVYDETMTRMEDQRAEPPADLPSSVQPPGVPNDVPTDAISTMAIKSVHNSPVTGTAASFKEGAKDHHNKLQKKSAKGKEPALEPVSPTSAVKISEDKPRAAAAAPATPTEVTKTEKHEHHDEKDEKKGIRGLISRIRQKSKSEKQPGSFMTKTDSKDSNVPYDATKAGQKPTPVATASDAAKAENTATSPTTIPPVDTGSKFEIPTHVGTDGAIGDATRISGIAGNPEPESPSSFNRHEQDLHDPDDASSSGADEDDVQRGRGGRIAKKLGFGNYRTKNSEKSKASGNEMERGNSNTSATEDETFEEARDHFDESLAPPPAFGGQKKSESPVRETRFKEDV